MSSTKKQIFLAVIEKDIIHKLIVMKKVLVVLLILIVAFGTVTAVGYISSQRLSVESFSVEKGLPDEIKILHLSDLHYPKCGVKTSEIIAEVEKEKPDIIVLTGDMLDESADGGDIADFGTFLQNTAEIAPTYAVLGNHEVGKNLSAFRKVCQQNNVVLLVDETKSVEVKGVRILMMGLSDGRALSEKNLPAIFAAKDRGRPDISILLAHRPELIRNYSDGGFDLIFAGHAHGGQVRLFNVGLYAPDQGLLPTYTSGRYKLNGSIMFVSRGLGDGNSSFRIFNSYNLVSVTIS